MPAVLIHDRPETFEGAARIETIFLLQVLTSGQHHQRIGHLEEPDRWHDEPRAGSYAVEQSVCRYRRLRLDDPGDRYRGVRDKVATHGRPAFLASRISLSVSGLKPFRLAILRRRARMSATARRTSSNDDVPSGTMRATGLSCLVMTISSPRATRSRSSPNRVFASKALMVPMP